MESAILSPIVKWRTYQIDTIESAILSSIVKWQTYQIDTIESAILSFNNLPSSAIKSL